MIGGAEARRAFGAGGSPYAQVALAFDLPGPLVGWVGAESAPLFSVPSTPEPRLHLFAEGVGLGVAPGSIELGAEALYGVSVRGVGLRVASLRAGGGGARRGPQVRALWLAPQAGAQVALAWTWEL